MKQRETELFGTRLEESMKQELLLQSIDISIHYDTVQSGSLVFTSIGSFFIAISADEVVIDEEEYNVISSEAPIALAMTNKKAGESFSFRGKMIKIKNVC
jgi:hypothetical protein